jgi:hypothetical protein
MCLLLRSFYHQDGHLMPREANSPGLPGIIDKLGGTDIWQTPGAA